MTDAIQMLQPKIGDIGHFEVRRLLPSSRRRMVGPFIFWDEMGPAEFEPGRGLDVRPHPHIGLATVTYLFDGELEHRDTLGVYATIRPGDVNIMAAGAGIVHSERTGADRRASGQRLHGIQAWIALPEEEQESAPLFDHQDKADLPTFAENGAQVTVIAGEAFGRTAPTRVFSPTLYLEVILSEGGQLPLSTGHEERAIYVVDGTVRLGPEAVAPQTMAIVPQGADVTLNADGPARVMVLGGAPLGRRYIAWNFVSTDQARIDKAKADWRASIAGGFRNTPFGMPEGEHEYIPLPEDGEGPPESNEDCPTS